MRSRAGMVEGVQAGSAGLNRGAEPFGPLLPLAGLPSSWAPGDHVASTAENTCNAITSRICTIVKRNTYNTDTFKLDRGQSMQE